MPRPRIVFDVGEACFGVHEYVSPAETIPSYICNNESGMLFHDIPILTGIKLQDGVTGTGRVGEGNRVLEVSSYPEKVWSAYQSGCKIFLVPYESLQESKQLGQLRIIPVDNLSEAWYVATTGTNASADLEICWRCYLIE